MEKKQTAVEWLVSELGNHIDMPHAHFIELVEEANAMEKKQIIEAHDNGEGKIIGNGEQYYNQTFKQD